MINSVVAWAETEKSIRALILVGSRAGNNFDTLSDYDFSIFSEEEPYIKNDHWLSQIGKPWICVHEKVYIQNREIPTRLVIFEGGIKADFAFFPLDILSSSLPDMGYTVLLDKDFLTKKIPKPSFNSPIKKPSEQEFLTIVKEFWFEVYHVAVYLKRNELWSAKVRANGIHNNFLLQMIKWNELSKNNPAIIPQGKKMQTWASPNTWNALYSIFAHFDAQDNWRALFATIDLFRHLATETAQKYNYPYPSDIDQNISKFILNLKSQ